MDVGSLVWMRSFCLVGAFCQRRTPLDSLDLFISLLPSDQILPSIQPQLDRDIRTG